MIGRTLKKAKDDRDIQVLHEKIKMDVKYLNEIYSNKSSDEYKCKGDITKSPCYEAIEYHVSKLSSLKGYPEADAKIVKECFNTLHRPIFSKMVTEYIAKPNERNTIFTATFTVGYRLVVGELARAFASTEATESGIKYKLDKISHRDEIIPFMKKYNKDLDKRLDEIIIKLHNEQKVQQEAAVSAVAAGAESIVGVIEGVFGFLGNIFRSAKSLNPVSLISAVLSRSYDKKIEKFEKVSREYEVAQKEYEEYKKIPQAQRKKRIEHKYVKMIEKYNIKMNNLKADIDHYDLRAKGDAKDAGKLSTSKKKDNDKTDVENENLPKSSSTVNTSSTSSNDNDFDF